MQATTLAARILPRPGAPGARLAREAGLVLAGSILVALTAQIRIPLPFSPVPITGQTFGVLLVGASLGAPRGALALALYLLEGAAGFPVYAGGSGGLIDILGPTGGYLLSYPIAAGLVGWLASRGWDRSVPRTLLAMLAGNVVIYLVGLPWLGVTAGVALGATMHTSVVVATLLAGLVPFIPGDVIKLGLAAVSLPGSWRLLGERRSG